MCGRWKKNIALYAVNNNEKIFKSASAELNLEKQKNNKNKIEKVSVNGWIERRDSSYWKLRTVIMAVNEVC